MEWKRFNQIVENQPQITDQPAYYDGGEVGGEPPILNSDSRHGRQLLKKLSNFNTRWGIFAVFTFKAILSSLISFYFYL